MPASVLPFLRFPFVIHYNPRMGFRFLPAGQTQQESPVDINSVALRAYDPLNNWLRVEASPGQAGIHTPNDANQVFRSIFDPTNNAVHVTCLSGCGATFGTDLSPVDNSHQKVVGFNSIPLSTAVPANGQVYQYSGSQNLWVPATLSSFAAGGDLTGSLTSQTVVALQGKPLAATPPGTNQVLTWNGGAWTPVTPATGVGTGACGSNQFVTGVNLGSPPNCIQPSFLNLAGALAMNQTSLTTNGDLLTVSGGALSRLPIGGANQCLQVNGAGSGYQFGSCGSVGTPGGSDTQIQFNHGGAFGGASNFTYNTGTGGVSIAGLAEGVPLAVSPWAQQANSDIFQVYLPGASPSNTCATNTKCAFAIQSSGNLFFAGNNATYGTPSQTTQSWLRLYGSVSGSSDLAPPYFQFLSGTGNTQAALFSSISQSGILCAGPSIPGGDCGAGQQLVLNPMTSGGDLIVGGSAVLGTAQPTRLPIGSPGQCLQVLSGPSLGYGGCGEGGNGTVTSVGLAMPSIFNVSGTPVTSAGTLTGTLAPQYANLVWAGPASGVAAAPTFRSLVKADQYSTTAYTDQANTWTAGAQDMSAAASFQVPVGAGLRAAVNGQIGYDSAANVPHMAVNSADAKLATFTAAPVTGDCVQWISATQIGDQGSPCGSGSGGGAALSSVTAAAGANTIANGNFPQVWNWAQTTASQSGLTFGETSAATGGGDNEIKISTQSNSTATPLNIAQGAITGTTAVPALSAISTWNNASLAGEGIQFAVSNISSSSSSTLLNLLAGTSGTTSEFSVNGTGVVTTNGMVSTGNIKLAVGEFLESNSGTGNLGLQCGQSGTTAQTACLNTVQGADITGGGTTNTLGGHVLIRGGNNAGTGSGASAGGVEIGAGQDSGASGEPLQGLYAQFFSYIKGSTVTQWNIQCFSAAMTTADCGASPGNWIGIAELVNPNTVQVIASGQAPVNSNNPAAVGDTFCVGPAAGKGADSGGTTACALGSQIGIVAAVSGTYRLPDGTSFTASTTLPLIQIARD